MSPTILRQGPYRFFFYSGDRNEPPHVHVERDNYTVKIWLTPTRLQYNRGFRSSEIREIMRIVEKFQEELLERWYEYFSD
jgi:hypothetical protein